MPKFAIQLDPSQPFMYHQSYGNLLRLYTLVPAKFGRSFVSKYLQDMGPKMVTHACHRKIRRPSMGEHCCMEQSRNDRRKK